MLLKKVLKIIKLGVCISNFLSYINIKNTKKDKNRLDTPTILNVRISSNIPKINASKKTIESLKSTVATTIIGIIKDAVVTELSKIRAIISKIKISSFIKNL